MRQRKPTERTPAQKAIAVAKAQANRDKLEVPFLQQVTLAGLPAPVQQHYFAAGRKWAFDFAWPELRIAAECEGGTWSGGRHTRGSGFESDCEKYNEAALMGWRVLRFTSPMILKNGKALEVITRALQQDVTA